MSAETPLLRGAIPAWACEVGEDQFGPYATVDVAGVRQCLRWIPPGTFMLGSPADEVGRSDDEVQRRVTLTGGYWIADTPVTQALWQAVMGENPATFVDPARPVEGVSGQDATRFVSRLNGRVPGLLARLPSEAEWAAACRAGVLTASDARGLRLAAGLTSEPDESSTPALDALERPLEVPEGLTDATPIAHIAESTELAVVTTIESDAHLEQLAEQWRAPMPPELLTEGTKPDRIWRLPYDSAELIVAAHGDGFRVWDARSTTELRLEPPVTSAPRHDTRAAVPVRLNPPGSVHVLFGFMLGSGSGLGSTDIAIYRLEGGVLRAVLHEEMSAYEQDIGEFIGWAHSAARFELQPDRVRVTRVDEFTLRGDLDDYQGERGVELSNITYDWRSTAQGWQLEAPTDDAAPRYRGAPIAQAWLSRFATIIIEHVAAERRWEVLRGLPALVSHSTAPHEALRFRNALYALAQREPMALHRMMRNIEALPFSEDATAALGLLNMELHHLKPFTPAASILTMNPWPRPDLASLGLDASVEHSIETPPGRWHIDQPPGNAVWQAVFSAARRTIGALPAGPAEIFVSAPYALGFAMGLWLTDAQADPRYWQASGAPGQQMWRPYGIALAAGDAVLQTEQDLSALPERTIRLEIGITHAIEDADIDLPDAVRVQLSPAERGYTAIPDARAAQRAAYDIGRAIQSIQQVAPKARLHIFYTGPLAVLMMAARSARTFGEVVVHERLQIGERPRFEPVIRIQNGRVTLVARPESS